MKIEGIIFDFNGTLFWDTEYQNRAWDLFLQKYNIELSPDEKLEYIHGRNGRDTLEHIFQKNLSSGEIEILTEEKECIYRHECKKHKMELAPGAVSFFNYLAKKNIKLSIATAAGKCNVDFFIDNFDLLKFFKKEHIIYNDGSMRGKPHPDMFNKAMDMIDVNKENILIFEDSKSGIEAAQSAKAGKIIIVNSNNENYSMYNYDKITHFEQVDRSLF